MHMDDDDIILEQDPDIDMFNLDDDLLDQLSPSGKEVSLHKLFPRQRNRASVLGLLVICISDDQSRIYCHILDVSSGMFQI